MHRKHDELGSIESGKNERNEGGKKVKRGEKMR
jgi:hypothetical protein